MLLAIFLACTTIDVPTNILNKKFFQRMNKKGLRMNHAIMDISTEDDYFMNLAQKEAELALSEGEVPIGCVFVKASASGEMVSRVLARGRNATNRLYNATLHAEIVALQECLLIDDKSNCSKFNRKNILDDITLYVTVEPCVMCMAALLDLKIHRIVFGCYNDRFGGCGGTSTNLFKYISSADTPQSNVSYKHPFWTMPIITSGVNANEAVMLLRRFYMNENSRAPNPKKKVNRLLKPVDMPIEQTSL
jgi:tRNA-specific adenosine deaminase 2